MEILRRGIEVALFLSTLLPQVHEDSYWDGNVRTIERLGHKIEVTVDCRREFLESLIEGKIKRTAGTPYPDSILTIVWYGRPDMNQVRVNVPSTIYLPRDQILGFWLSEPSGANSQLLAELEFECNSTKPYTPDQEP